MKQTTIKQLLTIAELYGDKPLWHFLILIFEIINGSKIYHLEEEGKIIGSVTLKRNRVSNLIVNKEYRNKGWGDMLLNESEQIISKDYESWYGYCTKESLQYHLNRGSKVVDYVPPLFKIKKGVI